MRFYLIFLIIVIIASACDDRLDVPIDIVKSPSEYKIIETEILDKPIAVIGSARSKLITHFVTNLNNTRLCFDILNTDTQSFLTDQLGNTWSIFGECVYGPWQGAQLEQLNSGMGYWFAEVALSKRMLLYGQNDTIIQLIGAPTKDWLIPTATVSRGAQPDAIKAIDQPVFEDYSPFKHDPDIQFFLEEDDIVIVVYIDNETKIYPHKILNQHEIVNDQFNDHEFTLIYSPLTGMTRVWRLGSRVDRDYFGVSGLVYNNSNLSFDRKSESLWTLIDGQCVFGKRKGEIVDQISYVETTWGTWLNFQSDVRYLSTATGFDYDYTIYPFGDYAMNEIITYPISHFDDRLPSKQRVYSVRYMDMTLTFQFADFL